jgi:cell division protein FtsX
MQAAFGPCAGGDTCAANIMVISVLERRSEIGLRCALGATKGHIRTQFLSEAILLALAGGAAGVVLGATATAVYAGRFHRRQAAPGAGLAPRAARPARAGMCCRCCRDL